MAIQSIKKRIKNIIIEDFNNEKIFEFANKIELFLSKLYKEINTLFEKDWIQDDLDKILKEEKGLLELAQQGYKYVYEARELVTNSKISITIGNVNSKEIYFANNISEEDVFKRSTITRVSGSNILKIMSSFSKRALGELTKIPLNSNSKLKQIYDYITKTEERMVIDKKSGKEKIKKVNKYGLNRGHIFELMYKASQKYRDSVGYVRESTIQKMIKDAKLHIPFYKSGDYDNIQLKATGTFSIAELPTIYKVLKFFCEIIKDQNINNKQKQERLNILFSPQVSDKTTMKILADSYEEAEQAIQEFINTFQKNE